MTHLPPGLYLLLGAALLWVGFLATLGLRHAHATAADLPARGHLGAINRFLAELLAQADRLGLPGEIERDAAAFQRLVAAAVQGRAPLSVSEMQDLSLFLQDLALALPYLPEAGAGPEVRSADAPGPATGAQDSGWCGEWVGLGGWAGSLADDMEEAIKDAHYALALASHDPSFAPGAPVSPFDAGGPAHMDV